ncbi:MAG: DUF4124 domain-containing protein [Rhodocyclaceae bacterium]|nr:DUF4124 domain-containing protein [Rhodocyclaceae bacterium]
MDQRLGLSLLVSGLLAAGPAAGQNVYRWVDAQGVTHYSETPPPGVNAERKQLRPAGAARPADTGATDWSEANRRFDARRMDQRDDEREAREKQHADAASRREHCDAMHDRMDTLRREAPVYRMNGAGEREYLDDEERRRELELTRKELAQACG